MDEQSRAQSRKGSMGEGGGTSDVTRSLLILIPRYVLLGKLLFVWPRLIRMATKMPYLLYFRRRRNGVSDGGKLGLFGEEGDAHFHFFGMEHMG
jgi:hypothetical protein